MRTQNYGFEKDGFKKGEYSIYIYSFVPGEKDIRSTTYCFGVSKLYEAKTACLYLNDLLAKMEGKGE